MFTSNNERLAVAATFFFRLNLFALPLYAMLLLNMEFVQLQIVIRDITFYFLNILNFNPSMSGFLISIPVQHGSWGAFINWDCTGWKSMLAFAALVLATPAISRKGGEKAEASSLINLSDGVRRKIAGLAIFIPLIFLVNLARIIFMFWFVKTYDLALYPLVHAVVWSWGLIFAVLAFWIIWMKKMR